MALISIEGRRKLTPVLCKGGYHEDRELECKWNCRLPEKRLLAVSEGHTTGCDVLPGNQNPLRTAHTGLSSILESRKTSRLFRDAYSDKTAAAFLFAWYGH